MITWTAFKKQVEVTLKQKPNAIPVANPDTSSISYQTPISLDVTANDTDGDNDPLSVTVATSANGTVTIGADKKTLTFTPASGFSGVATVTYTLSDGK